MGRPSWGTAQRENGTTGPIISNRNKEVIHLDDDVPPWEMQSGDTSEAFSLFVLFRDMGPTRTLKDITELVTKTEAALGDVAFDSDEYKRRIEVVRVRIQKKATTYRWWMRAEAYDRHMDRVALAQQEEERRKAVREVAKRHAAVAGGLTSLAGKKLQKIHTDEKEAALAIANMTLGELMALARSGIGLERMIHGIDAIQDERTKEEPVAPPPSTLSFEEAKRIARMAAAEVSAGKNDPEPPTEPPLASPDPASPGDQGAEHNEGAD